MLSLAAGGGAPSVSWPFAGLLCFLFWMSGLLTGIAVRNAQSASVNPRPSKARRRRSSYHFSEDDRSWGRHRWRSRLAWASAVAIVTCLLAAGTIAMANYKTRPNAAAGYRR